MNEQTQDPVLEILREIRAKQDETIAKQDRMDEHLKQIHADCKRTSIVAGAASGGVAGGVVAAVVMFIKAKAGL